MSNDVLPVRGNAAGIAYLRRQGTGTPLVLLHGIGSDAESWLPLMSALDPLVDTITWDAPGYGGSDALAAGEPTVADYAVRLAALLDALQLGRIHLVGHSLGCLFAACFAVSYPERVAVLGLLSPALGYGVPPGAPLPPSVQARIDDLVDLGAEAFAARRAARLVYRAAEKPTVLAGVRRAMAAVRLPGYAQAVRALGSGTLLADAARLDVPTFVAVGAEDVVTPPANARSVHTALRRPLGMEVVPDAGHALPQEAPVRVAQIISEGIDVRPDQ